ncbi:MAG TPA: response regulator transcription factor [Myxococcota bacterium]|nr:response regulator transcription factor [Myxococcota bacterium]
MQTPIRTVIVEDDPRYREGLERLLARAAGFTVWGSYGSAEALFGAAGPAAGAPFDLAIMDVGLPGLGGIEATRRIKRRWPEVAVVMLTVFEDPPTILGAICAGADGYTLKSTPAGELVEMLRSVADGGAPLTPGVARQVLDLVRAGRLPALAAPGVRAAETVDAPVLTSREQEVLRGLVRGLSYKQIAAELSLSLDTVRSHIKSLYKKLQVHSIAEAISRTLHAKLL